MGLWLLLDTVPFLRCISWNYNLCHNMNARRILFTRILLLTGQGTHYQLRAKAVGDHIVGLSGA